MPTLLLSLFSFFSLSLMATDVAPPITAVTATARPDLHSTYQVEFRAPQLVLEEEKRQEQNDRPMVIQEYTTPGATLVVKREGSTIIEAPIEKLSRLVSFYKEYTFDSYYYSGTWTFNNGGKEVSSRINFSFENFSKFPDKVRGTINVKEFELQVGLMGSPVTSN